jgi:hypothetical protein
VSADRPVVGITGSVVCAVHVIVITSSGVFGLYVSYYYRLQQQVFTVAVVTSVVC